MDAVQKHEMTKREVCYHLAYDQEVANPKFWNSLKAHDCQQTNIDEQTIIACHFTHRIFRAH